MLAFSTNSYKAGKPTNQTGLPSEGSGDLLDLFALIGSGKWTIALSVLAGAIVALLCALFLIKPVYQSETTLIYDPGQNALNRPGSGLSELTTDISAINTQIEVIRSHQMMRDLAARLDLINDPEFNPSLDSSWLFLNAAPAEAYGLDAAADRATRAISVGNLRNTRVLTLTARSHDPQKSAKVANALATLYVQKQIADKQREVLETVEWLSQRVATLEQDIEGQNAATQALNASIVSARAETLVPRISDAKTRLSALKQDQTRLRQQHDAVSELTPEAQTITDAELQRYAVAALSGDLTAGHDFARRKAQLGDALGRDLLLSQRQSESLRDALAKLEADYSAQTRTLADIQKIEREARATELLHQTLLSRLKETTLRQGLQTADSQIISPAIPGEKIAPRPVRMVFLGVLAGVTLGAGLVILNLYRRSSMPTAAQLEIATDYKVLGHLPKAPIRKRHQLLEYLVNNPTAPLAEAARNLRTFLLMRNQHTPPKIVLVTSSVPDEGKTTTAIVLAHNLAGLGRSVLLIEADIRSLSFQDYFTANPDGGLVTALSNDVPRGRLIRHDSRIGVDILMGEPDRRSAADLFASPEFRALLTDLRGGYDHIVIDSPPVLAVPDARVIGQSADAILLTVATAQTGRQQVQQALREFSSVNLSVTGLVMSDLGTKVKATTGSPYGAYAKYYTT